MTLLVRLRVNFVLNPEYHSWQWIKVCPGIEGRDLVTIYKQISEIRAKEEIRSRGLVMCAKDNSMEIWDTPERDFQKTYKKRIIVKSITI